MQPENIFGQNLARCTLSHVGRLQCSVNSSRVRHDCDVLLVPPSLPHPTTGPAVPVSRACVRGYCR